MHDCEQQNIPICTFAMRHKRTTTRQLQRLSTMRVAKERKRLRAADEFEPCGCVVFIGPMFGGAHVIRCKARQPGELLRVEIDGEAH